jgi:hypothetical protein
MPPLQRVQVSEEQDGIFRRLRADYPYFAARCLKIRAKSGELQPFLFNGVQDYVHQRLEQQKQRSGRVRALVLKARQEGVSTYVAGRFYHQASTRHGVTVFILTMEQDATDQIFGIVDRFHRHNVGLIAPTTGAANAKSLYFPRFESGYSVGTAGSKSVGRSRTITLFHGSEVAFFPNAKEHVAGALQTVPDLDGTEIVLESTANGIGGVFHEKWQEAESGASEYEAIFCPWWWMTDYQRPPPIGFEITEEEEDYAKLYGLTVPQMVWRRMKLAELGDPALFASEYPANASEAFQSTGHDAFIPSTLVLAARKRSCEAIGSLIVGVDPARYGDDSFAIAWRQGRRVLKVERRYKLGTIDGANWVKTIIDRDKPARVFVDLGNTGGGIVDVLHDWGGAYEKLVTGVNFGAAPQEPTIYTGKGEVIPGPRNRRSEMWMRSKAWLADEGGADIPDEDSLQADAIAPAYRYDARQFIVLESKEDIRKRGLRSPDGWDAVALTFAEPVKSRLEEAEAGGRWKRRTLASLWGR